MRQPLLLLHAGWLPPMVAARLLLLAAPLVASATTAGGASPLESELLLPATLLSPTSDAVEFCTRSGATPRFSWDAGPVPTAVAGLPDTIIEISSSPDFSAAGFLERDSVPAILSRYVRAKPLPLQQPGRSTYYWRVGLQQSAQAGPTQLGASRIVWSAVGSFEIRIQPGTNCDDRGDGDGLGAHPVRVQHSG
jgi:hypothetical protein